MLETLTQETVSKVDDPILVFCLAVMLLLVFALALLMKNNMDERKMKLEADIARQKVDTELTSAIVGLRTIIDQKVIAANDIGTKLDKGLENDQDIKTMLTELRAKLT